MTVKELIEKLEECNPDCPVGIFDSIATDGIAEIDKVEDIVSHVIIVKLK